LNVDSNLTKAEKLSVGDFREFFALLITGISINHDGIATNFLVETFYNQQRKQLKMTRKWFEEFVFFVVIDEYHVGLEVIDSFVRCKPEILPQWDPIGRLAK
jgi:aminopeptidase C